MIGVMNSLWYIPLGNAMCISSPATLPSAAPILNTGIKLPLGTGIVDAIIEKTNCKN